MKLDNKDYCLDNNTMNKILEIQEIISRERENITIEELLSFLDSAMNYGTFQVWLLKNKLNGLTLSYEDKLKKFLDETPIEEILKLYDVEQNYNERNIESVREYRENHNFPTKVFRLVERCSKPTNVQVSDKSREICARVILH